MQLRVLGLSLITGHKQSRLPAFSSSEKLLLKGSYDFFAVNHYTTWLVEYKSENIDQAISSRIRTDLNVNAYKDPTLQNSSLCWLTVPTWEIQMQFFYKASKHFFQVVTQGFRKVLKWIKDNYDDPEIIIAENGYSDLGELNDTVRIEYYKVKINLLTFDFLIMTTNRFFPSHI